MKLNINITKEILEQSKMCGVDYTKDTLVGQNCAIGKAIFNLFGDKSWVNNHEIEFYKHTNHIFDPHQSRISTVPLPEIAQLFISIFDQSTPEQRIQMTPFSFEIDVPEYVLEQIIDISEITNILKECKTIELVC